MAKYVLKRLILALITCFIVLSITYILISCLKIPSVIMPSEGAMKAYWADQAKKGFVYLYDFERADLGAYIQKFKVSAEGKTYFVYQTPVFVRYWNWLKGVVTRFDWGVSSAYATGKNCMDIITERLPVTLRLNIISVVISVPLGIGLGVLCALKKNSIFDNTMQVIIMIASAVPGFAVIAYCIMLAYHVDWLPAAWPIELESNAVKAAGYIIPVFVLSYGSIFGYARFVRAELCEVLESEYLLLARTKGLTRRQAIMRHAFRNAMVPVLPSVIAEFLSILGGSMILENLYQIKGVGHIYLEAFNTKDYALLMADMGFYTIIGFAANILVDISYGFIDPRIRMGAKK